MPRLLLLSQLVVFLLPAADWPRFRGPNGAGVDEASTGLPTEFGPSKNLAWKSAVPFGKSSPIVVGDRVFITASEGEMLLTLCLDANTGKLLWRREARRVHNNKLYKANDPASPSPASDGKNVYVFFQDLGLISYTAEGDERWRLPLGPFSSFFGLSSSPVLADGLVLLACDQQSGSFLIAVDQETGKQRWKTERARTPMSWSVPIVHTLPKGESELILVGSIQVDAYYLATGERKWWLPISSEGAMGSPVYDGETLLVSVSGHDQPWMTTFESALSQYDKDGDGRISRDEFKADKDWFEFFGWIDDDGDGFISAPEWKAAREFGGSGEFGVMAIHPGAAKGQLPATTVRWRVKRNLPYVPAPVLYKGVYFMVRTGGIVTALHPATGAIIKQGRASGAPGEYYASPVAADGKIFLLSEAGKLTVLKAAPEWDVLAVNDLGEESYATPAISRGRIYVRTRESLFCFSAPSKLLQ